jgi:hypothetical protein
MRLPLMRILLAATLSSLTSAIAQYASPEALVNAGATAYKASGPEEAIKAWIKDGPIDGNRDALNQANNLRTIENYYGTFQSAETIQTRDIGKNVHIVYGVLDYANGPMFARFVLFHTSKGWTLIKFNFNVDDTIAFADLKVQ